MFLPMCENLTSTSFLGFNDLCQYLDTGGNEDKDTNLAKVHITHVVEVQKGHFGAVFINFNM